MIGWPGSRLGLAAAQERVTTEEHRTIIARFTRWGLERRLRTMNPVSSRHSCEPSRR
jgi:hypothetical protein